MAVTTTQTRPNIFVRFYEALINMSEQYMDARGRASLFRELTAKSDEELAAMGLHRTDIARYVYRDILSV